MGLVSYELVIKWMESCMSLLFQVGNVVFDECENLLQLRIGI